MRRWLPTASALTEATFFSSVIDITFTVMPGRPVSVRLPVPALTVAMSPSSRMASRNDTLVAVSTPPEMEPSASSLVPTAMSPNTPPSKRVEAVVDDDLVADREAEAVTAETMPSISACEVLETFAPAGSTLLAVSVPHTGAMPEQAVPFTSTCRPFHEPAGWSLTTAPAYCTVSAPTWKVCAAGSWFFTTPFTANGGVGAVAFFSM